MPLTKQQLFAYHELGWVVVKRVADAATIKQIKAELEGVHERFAANPHAVPGAGASWEAGVPAGQPKRIMQLMGSQIVSPTLNAVIRRADVLDMVAQLIGPRIELYHSKLLMKAPHVPGFFPWHQDYGYWHFGEELPAQVNCALAIDPQTIANGCLHYVPGSHKFGLLNHHKFEGDAFVWGLGKDFNQFNSVPVEYDPGDMCFFGSLVIHGSQPNRTNESAIFNTTAYSVPGSHKDKNAQFEVLR